MKQNMADMQMGPMPGMVASDTAARPDKGAGARRRMNMAGM
jgi:hypothetical protein